MSSILKTTNIKHESSSSNNLVLGSDGNVSITNTLSAGTIGSSVTGFGLVTHADQWRYNTNYSGGSGTLDSTSNFQQVTSADSSSGGIGSGMTQDSGVFTFPATGIWLIICKGTFHATNGGIRYAGLLIKVTTNADQASPTFTSRSLGYSNMDDTNYYQSHHNMYMFDCQDTTTHKVRFDVDVEHSSASFRGSTTYNYNEFTFIRLGDT